jgi:hypothetical protein
MSSMELNPIETSLLGPPYSFGKGLNNFSNFVAGQHPRRPIEGRIVDSGWGGSLYFMGRFCRRGHDLRMLSNIGDQGWRKQRHHFGSVFSMEDLSSGVN